MTRLRCYGVGEVDLANAAKRCDVPECKVLVRYRRGRSGSFRTLCRKHALGQNSTEWKNSDAIARKPVTGGLVKKGGDPCTSMISGKSAEEARDVNECQARREPPAAMQDETENRKRGAADDSIAGNPSDRVGPGPKAQQENARVELDGIARSMATREGKTETMMGKVPCVQPPIRFVCPPPDACGKPPFTASGVRLFAYPAMHLIQRSPAVETPPLRRSRGRLSHWRYDRAGGGTRRSAAHSLKAATCSRATESRVTASPSACRTVRSIIICGGVAIRKKQEEEGESGRRSSSSPHRARNKQNQ